MTLTDSGSQRELMVGCDSKEEFQGSVYRIVIPGRRARRINPEVAGLGSAQWSAPQPREPRRRRALCGGGAARWRDWPGVYQTPTAGAGSASGPPGANSAAAEFLPCTVVTMS